jgi:hypothetical protein
MPLSDKYVEDVHDAVDTQSKEWARIEVARAAALAAAYRAKQLATKAIQPVSNKGKGSS